MEIVQIYFGVVAALLAALQIIELTCSCLVWLKTRILLSICNKHDVSFDRLEQSQRRIEDNISRRDLSPIVTVIED